MTTAQGEKARAGMAATAQGEKARAGMAAGNGGNTQGKGCQILSPPPEESDSSSDADN